MDEPKEVRFAEASNPAASAAAAPEAAVPSPAPAASDHSAAWTGTTGSKGNPPAPVKSAGLSLAALRAELRSEVRGWPGDLELAQCTVGCAFDLVRDAAAGCLFVIAPTVEVAKLKSHVEHADKGYMTRKLKDEKVWSEEFRRVFLDFATHEGDDRWPMDHPDEAARGQPKDGAIVISSSGGMRKGAAKLNALPKSQYTWASKGTRHMAAVQVAAFLDQAVVIIKSDGGESHVLFGRAEQRVAVFHVREEVFRPAGAAAGAEGLPDIREGEKESESDVTSRRDAESVADRMESMSVRDDSLQCVPESPSAKME